MSNNKKIISDTVPNYPLRLSEEQRAAIAIARDIKGFSSDVELINAALTAYLATMEIPYPATKPRGGNQRKAVK